MRWGTDPGGELQVPQVSQCQLTDCQAYCKVAGGGARGGQRPYTIETMHSQGLCQNC